MNTVSQACTEEFDEMRSEGERKYADLESRNSEMDAMMTEMATSLYDKDREIESLKSLPSDRTSLVKAKYLIEKYNAVFRGIEKHLDMWRRLENRFNSAEPESPQSNGPTERPLNLKVDIYSNGEMRVNLVAIKKRGPSHFMAKCPVANCKNGMENNGWMKCHGDTLDDLIKHIRMDHKLGARASKD